MADDFPGDAGPNLHDLLMAYYGSDQPYRAPSEATPADPAPPDPYPYGKPRFPNLDPRAYFDPQTNENYRNGPSDPSVLKAMAPYALALLGMRAGPRSTVGMRAFNPEAPSTPLPARPEVGGDNGIGQNVYEAMLGRTRKPGEDVAQPGSGWWKIGNQPIPKPSNVLPWTVVGGGGYGLYKGEQHLMDDYGNGVRGGDAPWGPLTWLHQAIGSKPFTQEELASFAKNEERRQEASAGPRAVEDAEYQDKRLANRLGIAPASQLSISFGSPLTPEQQAALTKRRLPGGVGKEPY